MIQDIVEYFEKLQRVLDAINKFDDGTGICNVTQREIGLELGVGQTAVSKYIKQLNREEVLVTRTKDGYVLEEKNIRNTRQYRKVMETLISIVHNPEKIIMPEKELAEENEVKISTIQMLKTLLKAGKGNEKQAP